MPSLHSSIGPSALPRVLRCPGSVKMCEGMADETSEAAAEGTCAHHIREMCLVFGFEPEEFIGDIVADEGFTFPVTADWAEALRPGIERIRDRPGRMVNEYRVSLDTWLPGQVGTLDVGIIGPDLIEIDDLKFGQGVPVQADDNEQLMAYALGFWENVARHETDATDFLIVIDQPRAVAGGGEWRTTLDELLEYGERLKVAFAAAHEEDPILKAGEKQCLFCKAKGVCGELARFNLETMGKKFDDLDLDGDELRLSEAEEFTPEQRVQVALNKGLIEGWLKAVKARVLSDALAGLPTPGVKAAAGRRGDKAWKDPAKAESFITKFVLPGEVFAPAKIITPTQAEKLVPKKHHEKMAELWDQSEGAPSLVPEDSEKPAIRRADKFD